MTIKRLLAASAVPLILGSVAACTPNDIDMGASAKHNYAAQIVDPEPVYEKAMAASGDQTAAAQARYRKGTVKKPVRVNTTSGSGGGGSGSGSKGN